MKKVTLRRPMFVLQTYEDRNSSAELSQISPDKLTNPQDDCLREKKSPLSRQTSSNLNIISPPPPPPLPTPEKHLTNGTKTKPKAPPVPEKRSTLSSIPPPCPTPDYDTLSIASSTSAPRKNGHSDVVEMESLESFEMFNPSGNKPKPPDIYFSDGSSGTLRKQRPVSVTIGEYGNGTLRKPPGKLEFLQGGREEVEERRRQTVTSQFASELARTLNRSNLKRRTESMPNCDK